MIPRAELIKIGFQEIPHFTIQQSLIYDLGRNRNLSLACLGTPNEMLFIGEADEKNSKLLSDVVVLSNYDYDGYLTLDKIKMIITAITNKQFS